MALLLIALIATFNLSPLGYIAAFITAIVGAATGVAALRQQHRTAKEKADTASVRTLGELVDRYRTETARMQGLWEACERDKDRMQEQINDLYVKVGEARGNGR